MGFGAIVVPGCNATTNRAQDRRTFASNLLALLGDTRLLWLPDAADIGASTDQSLNGRVLAADAAMSLTSMGLGYSRAFNGTSQYLTTPDVANLSFGNGTVDSAFSIVAVANVTDAAASRVIVSKHVASNNAEWQLAVTGADALQLAVFDASASALAFRSSNAAIMQGSWSVIGATYSAATGGATAANDMALYQGGLVVASTATNSGSYTAMEDTSAEVAVGASTNHTAAFFSGSLAMVAVCQKNLTASEQWAIHQLCRGYFDF
jgi:hypothetical protein